ncbi:MAG: VIT domain-containing protein [bacterium]|nr:VIT domain-containing protein [bacterium]
MKKYIFIILLFPLLIFSQSASLVFQHPQQTSKYATGIIENAKLVIQPFGSYTKNDLYLTFSAKGMTMFQPNDSLEIRLTFSHITGGNFTDMWLWIGNEPVRALIADRAKAKATYEGIVKRRQDPALLERTSENNYKLSIYPMRADSSRKIKLSYFIPGTLSDSNLTTAIPYWIFRSSSVVLFNTSIIVLKDSIWKNPVLKSVIETPLLLGNDPEFGAVYSTLLTPSTLLNLQSLSVVWKNSSFTQPYLVEQSQKDSSGVFQLSIQPGKVFGLNNTGKKFLFLVNYDSLSGSSAYSRNEIVNDLSGTISNQLTSKDSFNVIFSSKQTPLRLRNSWISAHKDTVNSLFTLVKTKPNFLDGFDLSKLLFNAIDFIKGSGVDGQIILISSSEEYYKNISLANIFADSLFKLLPAKTQIHIIDNDQWYHYHYLNGRYYYGNQYLYELLANKTLGSYFLRTISPGYYDNNGIYLTQYINAIRGKINYLDMTVTLQNGITYMKQTLGYPLTSVASSNTIRQAGLFKGNFPMNVELTGQYDGNLLYKKLTIPESEVITTDSSLYSVWASYLINNLRTSTITQEIKQQMSDLSIKYRILSEYTAFIALEPGQKLCDTCSSNSGGTVVTISNKEITSPTTYEVLQAYPNPFNPTTTLTIRLPQGIDPVATSLAIYNTLGQQVKRFDATKFSSVDISKIIWDAKDEKGKNVASGMYIVVLNTPKGMYSLKLIMVK